MKTLTLGVVIALLSACSTMSTEETSKPSGSLAILPFENLTQQRSAGIVISKLFYSEIFGNENINLIEESWVRNWLKKHEINVDRLADTTSAKALGEKLNADQLLLGSVSRYGTGSDLFSTPAVAVNVQLIDVNSGKVLWADSRTDLVSNNFWSSQQNIESLAQEIVAEMTEDLFDQ